MSTTHLVILNSKQIEVLGHTQPDPVGHILGTGYSRFYSPSGIHGLFKATEKRLDLLAVAATAPGAGQFRVFMRGCKEVWPEIFIWETMNSLMELICLRYGFQRVTENDGDESLNGWRWEAVK